MMETAFWVLAIWWSIGIVACLLALWLIPDEEYTVGDVCKIIMVSFLGLVLAAWLVAYLFENSRISHRVVWRRKSKS